MKNYWLAPVLIPSYKVGEWIFYKFTHFYKFNSTSIVQSIFNEPTSTSFMMYENDNSIPVHFKIIEFDLLPYDPKAIGRFHSKIDGILSQGAEQLALNLQKYR